MRPITIAGFERTFRSDEDPWRTFSNRDEARKRAAILHALGPGSIGRVLELGAGNGSNSVALATRTLRLDAIEGTESGTRLTAKALAREKRARALTLILPGRFPRTVYDAIIIAELLYYLTPRAMAAVARDVGRSLRPNGLLVLAHHRVDFHDFAQHAAPIHERFLAATGRIWTRRTMSRTGRWHVERCYGSSPPT